MPRLVRLTRRRLLLGLALMALVGLVLWAVYCLESWGMRGPFWHKYQRIRLGMEEDEVKEILGRPPDEEAESWFYDEEETWFEDGQAIDVKFDGYGAKIRSFRPGPNSEWIIDPPETWRERLGRILKAFGW